jgi:RPA family protein
MAEKKRLIAMKVRISEITKGKWVPREGLNPNYVLARTGKRLSRVRIIATAVNRFMSQDRKFASITLDDGTDTIRAKAFGSLILENIKLGDIIDIVGKLKQYNDELYIVPEIIAPANIGWEMLRELEIRKISREWDRKRALVKAYQKQTSDVAELKSLALEFGISSEDVEGMVEAQEFGEDIHVGKEEVKQRVLDLIASCDHGEGCDYSELIERAGMQESALDETMQELLSEGSCFEPKPGKIKRL